MKGDRADPTKLRSVMQANAGGNVEIGSPTPRSNQMGPDRTNGEGRDRFRIFHTGLASDP